MTQTTMGWKAECEEWQAISDEPTTHAHEEWQAISDEPTTHAHDAGRWRKYKTAYDVSLEQRKRMLARGQRPMTYEEINNEYERTTGECTCALPAKANPTGPCSELGVWFGPLEDGLHHQDTCVKVIEHKRKHAAAQTPEPPVG